MKSYVTIATKICPVCGVEFDSGELLMDRRMRETFEMRTLTGMEMCDEHKRMVDDGFIHLIVVKNERRNGADRLKPEDADRTGEVVHMKREAATRLFNVQIDGPMLFIDEEVAEQIRQIYVRDTGEQPPMTGETK